MTKLRLITCLITIASPILTLSQAEPVAATIQTAAMVTFPTVRDKVYTIEKSTDLSTWVDSGSDYVYGNGETKNVFFELSDSKTFYRASSAERPSVASTTPATGSVDVDPALNQISITFSEPYRSGLWSSALSEGASLLAGGRSSRLNEYTVTRTVSLQPNTKYALWLNREDRDVGFENSEGVFMTPFLLVFTTR